MLTFCVLSDITLFQQFNYMREETPSVSMQSLCFVRILHYGIYGNLGFVPQVVLSSFLPCACVLLCPAGVWAKRCVLLLAGEERLPCRVSSVTVQCVARPPHLPALSQPVWSLSGHLWSVA